MITAINFKNDLTNEVHLSMNKIIHESFNFKFQYRNVKTGLLHSLDSLTQGMI